MTMPSSHRADRADPAALTLPDGPARLRGTRGRDHASGGLAFRRGVQAWAAESGFFSIDWQIDLT